MVTDLKKIRLLLVDDHPVVREGLKSCLAHQDHLQIIGEAKDGEEAIRMAMELIPDVVLMDINMPRMNGLEAARELRLKIPKIKVLILTVHNKKEYVLEIIRTGAQGYLLKDAGPEELNQAIEAVNRGEAFFSPAAARFLVEHHTSCKDRSQSTESRELSKREREVLVLIAKEYRNKEIANQFGVSVRTIETYRERIMQKLDIHTSAGLTKFAISTGIISLE